MRTWYIVGICALIAGAGLFWYFTRSTPIQNFPSKGTHIIAFGDSLIQGVGASPEHDLVSLLSQRIGEPIVNLGHAGDTTADGLVRISELDQYNPKVVLLLLGGNDYLRRVPADQTFENLGAIITNIQSRGAVVLLLGVRGGVLSDHFDTKFEDLQKAHKTAYVSNVLAGLIGHDEYMSDQIHPNDAGYARIVDRIYPVLLPLLQ